MDSTTPQLTPLETPPPPPPSFTFASYMVPGYVLQMLCIAFYGCVLVAVQRIKNKAQFGSQFYHLFFFIGSADLIHAIALLWMCFEHEVIHGDALFEVTYVCSWLTCSCYLIHIIGNGLMAVNRYSATFTFHTMHFCPKLIGRYFKIIVAISAFCSIPAFFRHRNYVYENGDWTYTLSPDWVIKLQRYIIIFWMALYMIIAPTFTIMTRLRCNNFINVSYFHRSDQSLVLFNVLHMIFHFFVFLYELFEVFQSDNVFIIFIHAHFYIFLFGATVLNSLFITCTTTRVRLELSKVLCQLYKQGKGKISGSNNNTIQVVPSRF
ncbi:unnamed protein product [Caenorhabditis nigoni]